VKIRFKEKESMKVINIVNELIWYDESATLAFPFAATAVPALEGEESASGEDPCDREVGDAGTCCVGASPLSARVDVSSGDNVRLPVIVEPVMGIGSVIRVWLDA